jgi:hypothetical protein
MKEARTYHRTHAIERREAVDSGQLQDPKAGRGMTVIELHFGLNRPTTSI